LFRKELAVVPTQPASCNAADIGHWCLVIGHWVSYNRAISRAKDATLAAIKIQIVGIGDDGIEGLTASARQLVERAEVLIGAQSLLNAATSTKAEKVEIGGDLDAIVRKIQASRSKRLVLLTAGDPMFYGTARYLCDRLGKDSFEVTPMSAACSSPLRGSKRAGTTRF
jgi:hypothetical protein